jgi:hypothetical protein
VNEVNDDKPKALLSAASAQFKKSEFCLKAI